MEAVTWKSGSYFLNRYMCAGEPLAHPAPSCFFGGTNRVYNKKTNTRSFLSYLNFVHIFLLRIYLVHYLYCFRDTILLHLYYSSAFLLLTTKRW